MTQLEVKHAPPSPRAHQKLCHAGKVSSRPLHTVGGREAGSCNTNTGREMVKDKGETRYEGRKRVRKEEEISKGGEKMESMYTH